MEVNAKFYDEFVAMNQALNFLTNDITEIQKAYNALIRAKKERREVFIFGNGGSASTASHFANDLWKMARIRAISLPDLTSTMMAYGNDDGWDKMFFNFIYAMIHPMDVLVGISCSGNSMNVVKAMQFPNPRIVLTGDQGGKLKDCDPDAIIYARHPDIRIQENIHLIVCHMLAGALKNDG